MNSLKEKVTKRLISKGNNENDVVKMVEKHFEYASKKYCTIKQICECIRTIY